MDGLGGEGKGVAEGIYGTGNMRFGTAYHDAVLFLFNNVDILVRVSLLAGGKAAVAFRVCHGPGDEPVLFLHFFQEI